MKVRSLSLAVEKNGQQWWKSVKMGKKLTIFRLNILGRQIFQLYQAAFTLVTYLCCFFWGREAFAFDWWFSKNLHNLGKI